MEVTVEVTNEYTISIIGHEYSDLSGNSLTVHESEFVMQLSKVQPRPRPLLGWLWQV